MERERTIMPGRGVWPLELGCTRAELWSRTDSDVLAYCSKFEPGERSDDFRSLGITVHYRGGCAAQLMAFPRVGPSWRLVPLFLEDEDISAFTRADMTAFCDLRGWGREDDLEFTRVPALNLTFWYRHDADEPERLEFVRVE